MADAARSPVTPRRIVGAFLGVSLLGGLPVLAGTSALTALLLMLPGALPPVQVPPENPITETKRVLGKALFFDEQLSSDNTVACATCHTPGRSFSDGRRAANPGVDGIFGTPDDKFGSPGIPSSSAQGDYQPDPFFAFRPQVTRRAAPTAINSAYAPELFWDGRAHGQFTNPQTGAVSIAAGGALESQSVGPPVSDSEMAYHSRNWNQVAGKLIAARPLALATSLPPDLIAALAGGATYPQLFRRAFGDAGITAERIAFALATYERTLIADDTPWDRFIAGDPNALTPAQAQGFQAFQASRCINCHVAPLFTGEGFRNIGLRPPAEDTGRQEVTGDTNDRGKFKVPSLRNVGLKTQFMHNGQFTTLPDVIRFYARAPGAAPQFPENRDPIMLQVNVPPQAAQVIQDFIQNGLTDPRVAAQTFPFDKPTLFVERPGDRPAFLGGGVAGSGGLLPQIITATPPMIGSTDFKIGLFNGLGGAAARLAVSGTAPVGGVVSPDQVMGPVTAAGSGSGAGYATLHWPIQVGAVTPGQTLYVQWMVDDAGAPGGRALSQAVRITFFCGSGGCAGVCRADINGDGAVNVQDFLSFLAGYAAQSPASDMNSDGATDVQDFLMYLDRYSAGC
jgi:cytochrome c peroxidase